MLLSLKTTLGRDAETVRTSVFFYPDVRTAERSQRPGPPRGFLRVQGLIHIDSGGGVLMTLTDTEQITLLPKGADRAEP